MDTDNSSVSQSQSGPSAGSSLDNVILFARAESVTTIFKIVNTLSQGKKNEIVTIIITDKGIKCIVDNTRCYQGNAFLEASLFNQYTFNSQKREEFSIGLSPLLDCLNIYGPMTATKIGLQMAYPAYGKPLCLMLEGNSVVTDCGIKTVEPVQIQRHDIKTSEILCKIIMKSSALYDALNELDWSNDSMTWEVSPDAPYFRLSVRPKLLPALLTKPQTQGSGTTCQVDYPKDIEIFEEWKCHRTAKKDYKLKHLQPSMKALSAAHKTQIRINEQGLLNMQHMIVVDEQVAFVDFFVVPLEKEADSD